MLPCKSIHNKIKDELSNKYFYPIIASNVDIYNNTNTISKMPKGLSFALNYLEDSYHFDYITLVEVKDLQERLEYLLRMKNHNDYWNEIIDSIKRSRSYNIHINGLKHFQLCNTDYTKDLIKYIKDCDYVLRDEFIRLINNSVTKEKFLTSIFHNMYYGYGNDNYVLTDYYKISKLYEKLIIENKQFDYNKVREEFMDKNSTDKDTSKAKKHVKNCSSELSKSNTVESNADSDNCIGIPVLFRGFVYNMSFRREDIVCIYNKHRKLIPDDDYFIFCKTGKINKLTSYQILESDYNMLKEMGIPVLYRLR